MKLHNKKFFECNSCKGTNIASHLNERNCYHYRAYNWQNSTDAWKHDIKTEPGARVFCSSSDVTANWALFSFLISTVHELSSRDEKNSQLSSDSNRGRWVRSANATSVLMQPPKTLKVKWAFQDPGIARHKRNILASHPAASSLNLGSAEIFYLYWLVCEQYWDLTHLVLSNGFHKCSRRWHPELGTTKKFDKIGLGLVTNGT